MDDLTKEKNDRLLQQFINHQVSHNDDVFEYVPEPTLELFLKAIKRLKRKIIRLSQNIPAQSD